MAAGQVAFTAAADAAALHALGRDLQVQEAERGALHARQLRTLLRLHAVDCAAGLAVSTVANSALLLGASEHRVDKLLSEALLLGELPGGLEAVECGLLTVEQSSTVVEQLTPLPVPLRAQVWRRLQATLAAEADLSVLPPARLRELLRRWVLEADREAAEQRRREAQAARRVDYRLRPDGLGDLFAFGFTGPDLQAVLSRIRVRSAPTGPEDDRTADQRRFDAVKDLLLGRDPLPLHDPQDPAEAPAPCAASGGGRARCGCWPGAPVPCGAQLIVHVPIGAALGTTDEIAELVGHGPLEPDLLRDLLLAAPRLRVVWTDEHGVPVAVGDQTRVPQRDDPGSVRQALLDLLDHPPDRLHPRHPDDHPAGPEPPGETDQPPDDPPGGVRPGSEPSPRPPCPPAPSAAAGPKRGRNRATAGPPRGPVLVSLSSADARVLADAALRAAVRPGAHPPGQPGPYRVPRRLRRLLEVRSPRCEWPGCGARAVRCDAEHDRAHPDGPTCACNLGPCCRRHHRVKQTGWTKTRLGGSALLWTDTRTGRQWTSRSQHEPSALPVRALPPVPLTDPYDELSPYERDLELLSLGLLPDDPDPRAYELRAIDPCSIDLETGDVLGEHLCTGDTRWTLDLDNPSLWILPAAPAF